MVCVLPAKHAGSASWGWPQGTGAKRPHPGSESGDKLCMGAVCWTADSVLPLFAAGQLLHQLAALLDGLLAGVARRRLIASSPRL
eukprot:3095281-Alexandrium_andersonii.AAC.1